MKLSRTCQASFYEITPLNIRGTGGVMEITEITPFNPPYSKGEIEEGAPYFKREI
jgi:hypothetical protein